MARKLSDRALHFLQVLADEDRGLVKEIVQIGVREVLEAEMQQFLGAAPYRRSASWWRGEPINCGPPMTATYASTPQARRQLAGI